MAKDDTPEGLKRKDVAYWKLGDFIFDENPYPRPAYPRAYTRNKRIKRFGVGKSFHKGRVFGKVNVSDNPKLYLKGLFWSLTGKNVRVSKAIRIPYTYFDPKKRTSTRGALLIGYEGGGGGM